ncbi:alpha/beta fold hydrolase [Marinomonas mediterranea]|uniref:alpha/beta hydrolase n=1 Tax=Marinomonas mediterranea TaxID=119864 RepID=UPI00234A12B3|nr:alpha/beta hydrolase [Marinomonas mediterranea]WCN14598.1 alpha/beta fold hydrolase [Marinomonas mediterranea]
MTKDLYTIAAMKLSTVHTIESSIKTTDHLGDAFTYRTLTFRSNDRFSESTLVQHQPKATASRAILYLHGYTDYFFQSGLAELLTEQDWAFYAIDLQGYGRSIRPQQPENRCRSLSVYHNDLISALTTIKKEGYEECVILAHSTGGLIASRFIQVIDAVQKPGTDKQTSRLLENMATVSGLILNSPFLALPFSPQTNKRVTSVIHFLTTTLPFISKHSNEVNTYSKSIHKHYEGQWNYRLDWKPANGFPLSFRWLREVIKTQRELLEAPQVSLPTLMCHSDKTTRHEKSCSKMAAGDGVLNIDSMMNAANQIYRNLETKKVEGGYHDLYLSPEHIRKNYIASISVWLDQLP